MVIYHGTKSKITLTKSKQNAITPSGVQNSPRKKFGPAKKDPPDPSSSPMIFLDLRGFDADGTSSKKYTLKDEHFPWKGPISRGKKSSNQHFSGDIIC